MQSLNQRESGGIARKSAAVSALVLAGKALGFLKQSVVAWAFGSNAMTDVFFAADGFTSMFSQIMSQSVTPTVLTGYIKTQEERGEDEAKGVIRSAYVIFGSISLLLVMVTVIFAPTICDVIGASYTLLQKQELRFYLVSLCPVIIIATLSGVSSGYLDAHNRFIPGRMLSLFFSVSIIVFIFIFRGRLGMRSYLYGFLAGYALHLVMMLVMTLRKVSAFGPMCGDITILRSMAVRFVPLVVGSSVVDVGQLIDKIIASSLSEGSVSALYYGQVISSDVVSAVVISSIGAVLLTSLTRRVASGDKPGEIVARLQEILCAVTALSLFFCSLYLVEACDLVELFFERGSFTHENTLMVTSVALAYAAGFSFIAAREVLVKAHFAYGDTLSPMLNGIIGIVTNIVFSVLLSKRWGVVGLPIATSISMAVIAGTSLYTLKTHVGSIVVDRACLADFAKSLVALAASVVIGRFAIPLFGNVPHVVRLLLVGCLTALIYAVLVVVLGERAALHVVARLRWRCSERQSAG